jgi:hypothetical protein
LHFGGVDVAFAVDGEIVEVFELAGVGSDASPAAEALAIAPTQHVEFAVRIVGDHHVALLRVGPEHDRAGRARNAFRHHAEFFDVGAVLLEDLDAVVAAIADIDLAVPGHPDAVHGVRELLRQLLIALVDRHLHVCGRLAIGAPMALVGAGRRVEHDHAVIAVTVGDIELVGCRVDDHVSRAAETGGVVAAGQLACAADLLRELAVARELQDLAVLVLGVAADPDEIVVVDEDPVLVGGPLITLTGTAPGLDDLSFLIELDDRRCRDAAPDTRRCSAALLTVGQRAGAMEDPDVILRVDIDAAGLADDPIVRERFRPGRVDLEFRRFRRKREVRGRESDETSKGKL